MQSPDQNHNSSQENDTDSWMKSIAQPSNTTPLGYFFVGMSILFWSSSLTKLFGYDHTHGYGGLIFSAVGLTLTFLTIFVNRLMVKMGLGKSVRSGLWMSAVVGSYVTLTTYPWGIPIFSNIAGFLTSILTFIVTYQVDKKLG